MIADLDYGSIQNAMEWKAAQSGGRLVRLSVPEPVTHDALISFYDAAMAANPDVRLLLLTHVSHRTGLVIPVPEIVAAARLRGVDVIVDAAHSWGQIDFDVAALGADFVGFNLHKWIGAPIGVGVMYIKGDRLEAVSPDMSAEPWERDDTGGRVHTGTMNFAAVMSLPDALDFHDQVGPTNKAARLAYLRNAWVGQVRPLERIEILTPDDPRIYAGITSFRVAGKTSAADNKALAERLLAEFDIFSVLRDGVAAGCCVRITPALYNTPDHADRLAEALHTIVQKD
jgi:isopenicillin-N epimerase